mmetsp:Transcript_7392/g.21231  ORF Transcript_7392/g.21231 Transcript_7392/m.21231 type:complete len:237 (+) Transcript_7392:135-845(+)
MPRAGPSLDAPLACWRWTCEPGARTARGDRPWSSRSPRPLSPHPPGGSASSGTSSTPLPTPAATSPAMTSRYRLTCWTGPETTSTRTFVGPTTCSGTKGTLSRSSPRTGPALTPGTTRPSSWWTRKMKSFLRKRQSLRMMSVSKGCPSLSLRTGTRSLSSAASASSTTTRVSIGRPSRGAQMSRRSTTSSPPLASNSAMLSSMERGPWSAAPKAAARRSCPSFQGTPSQHSLEEAS